jgi:hypothetical protein
MSNTMHSSIRNGTGHGQEGVPPPSSPERPPLSPHDPPGPAPQAAAWERALRVVFMERTRHTAGAPHSGGTPGRAWRANKRGRAAIRNRH